MYINTKNIEDIKYIQRYSVDEENLVYILENSEERTINCQKSNSSNWSIGSNLLIDATDLTKNFIVVKLQDGTGRLFSKTGEEITSTIADYNYIHFSNSFDDFLFCEFEKDEKWYGGIFDLNLDRLLWTKEVFEIGSRLIQDNTLIKRSRYHNEIIIENLKSGDIVWQFSLAELSSLNQNDKKAKITRIVGILLGVLVLQVRISTDLLIGLDAKTGKLLWQLADFEYEGVHYPYLPTDIYKVHANTESTRLISINGGFLEINPLDGKVLKYKPIVPQDKQGKFTEYNGEGFIPFDGKAQGKYVYFSASVREKDGRAAVIPASVGIYNMETEQVEWLHVFKEFWQGDGNAIYTDIPPLVSNNRLYVLDIKGTLHIFEKED